MNDAIKHSIKIWQRLAAWVQLTKPTIMLLVLVTGAAAICLEGSFLSDPVRFTLVLFGLYLTGGSANALNQYFERDIDARMERTKNRRPLPRGQVSPSEAIAFAVVIGAAGVALFALAFNWLSAALALATVLFYGFFYTLYLKPRTHLNIVIGGAAGAMAPPIAWAAASGTTALAPWLLFGIVFVWTPPHFWALALFRKRDYEQVGLPMLPNVRGDRSTLNQIFAYAIALVAISLALTFTGSGNIYVISAGVLGGLFLKKAWEARRLSTASAERGLFGFSIIYLLALFSAVIVDGIL